MSFSYRLLNVGHISTEAAEKIVSLSAKKAGIKKRVYPHLLRASFATRLIENKVPIEKNPKTAWPF